MNKTIGNLGVLAVFIAGIIGGFGGVFIKYIDLSASAIAWLRTSVPAIVLFIWMRQQRIQFFRGNYKRILLASVLNTIRLYLFIVAFIYTSIGNAIILFYSYPVFVALFEHLIFKQQIVKKQLLLLIAAFIGLIIAYSSSEFSFESKDFIGMSAAQSSSIIYALTVNLFKSESSNFRPYELVFYQNIIGAIVFIPFFIMSLSQVSMASVLTGVSYGVVIGIGVFSLFFYGLKTMKASQASAIMYMEVVSAILLSYFWMGDKLHFTMILGGSIIILSSFLISRIKSF